MPIFPLVESIEDVWDQEAFRAVDTSVGALVLQLTRALVGLTTAYVVGRILTERWLDLGDRGADVMLATAIHVGLAGLALFLTSARPIRRDLAAQRALLRASEAEMVERVQQQAFLRDLQDALDMGETEADALEVTAKALRDAAPGPAELLVADASRAHLRRAADRGGQRARPAAGSRRPGAAPPFAGAAPSTSRAATTSRRARACRTAAGSRAPPSASRSRSWARPPPSSMPPHPWGPPAGPPP